MQKEKAVFYPQLDSDKRQEKKKDIELVENTVCVDISVERHCLHGKHSLVYKCNELTD